MLDLPRILALLLIVFLAACASGGHKSPTGTAAGGAHYKVGQPYQIKGIWYYPKEDYAYDETGIASWYGDAFHDKATSNGEIFNKNELTAAHNTLPMPSLARVTNLENGRSLVVRINDRGPFSGARIIDVTQRAAQLLGFEKQGTAKVRVQVLADESKAIADAMRRYGSPAPESVKVASAAETPSTAPVAAVTAQQLEPPVIQAETSQAQLEALPPLPATKAEAHAMMATIQPVPEVKQLPVTGNHRIFIQAGAFTQHDNASRLKQKLSHVGHVTIADAQVKGVKFYRVRLGPMPDVTSADKLLKKVVKAGANGAKIVVD
ncbi:MAG: septal ring lytic transglycosylase RlpA family protein [Alphaproteobacteria bacterium]|nr:septal ring lytic transglycosylase RlpA family protein [Alphaproteobacteria bacterium]